MSPACPADLAPRPLRRYEASSASFAFPRVLIFWAFFLVVPASTRFVFLAAGFRLLAEAFPVFNFPAFLFFGDMFLSRLLPEFIILSFRCLSVVAPAVPANFTSRHYNAGTAVRVVAPRGLHRVGL